MKGENMQINKHGSFYMRSGWVTKIIDAIRTDDMIFSPNKEEEAVDSIGVGRVMIKAMRYWSVVLGISYEAKVQRGVVHKLTPLGNIIADHDPYCQDIGTLWLLHRNLSSDIDNATAWFWAFNQSNLNMFSKDSFSTAFYAYLQKSGSSYAKSAVEKEFDCFKNTYVSDKAFDISKVLDEDTIPFFSRLKLIQYLGNGNFQLKRPTVKDIPLEILLYCILNDNYEHLSNNTQLSIDELLESNNQVGKYMHISYSNLLELLLQLENMKKLTLVNNFGNRYIQLKEFDVESLLANYYLRSER